jgi:transposase-like protein
MAKRDPDREERWRAVVSEWEQSGQSARAFCRERQVNEHTFYGWRRELRRRDGQSKNSGGSGCRQRFVQVDIAGPSCLELSLGGDVVLRVPSSVGANRLTEILVAARKAAGC